MKVAGNYIADGYAHVSGIISPDIANAILSEIKIDTAPGSIPLSQEDVFSPVLKRAAFEVYGPHYTPMKFLLWALTPVMEDITGVALAPSYNYFRVYRGGDVCHIHSDRPACEHSMTLTLAYSDGANWPFCVGRQLLDEGKPGPITDTFGDEPHATISMDPGDAVIYRGMALRHGRPQPNPNCWSAHMFLHWVAREGRHIAHAFEGRVSREPLAFSFA